MAQFCSDVQVRGYYPSYIQRLLKKHGVRFEMLPGDEGILQENLVDFLSFSYYMSSAVSTDNSIYRYNLRQFVYQPGESISSDLGLGLAD